LNAKVVRGTKHVLQPDHRCSDTQMPTLQKMKECRHARNSNAVCHEESDLHQQAKFTSRILYLLHTYLLFRSLACFFNLSFSWGRCLHNFSNSSAV